MRRLLALFGAIALCAACAEPPQKEIDRAQGAIDAARAAGADSYAAAEFTAATTALQQAHDAVAQRDYRTALSRALTASERAQEAARQAAEARARARADAEVALSAATTSVQQLRSAIAGAEEAKLPSAQLAPFRAAAGRFDTRLQEARTHLDAGRYAEASTALRTVTPDVREQIRRLNELTSKLRPTRRRR